MQNEKRIVCVLPAYNAAKTLEKTLRGVAPGIVDHFVLVDDSSTDETVAVAETLTQEFNLAIVRHAANRGYGANQKSCYRAALDLGADVVIMLHPDYQYDPRLVEALSSLVASGVYDVAIGSRMLAQNPIQGGMPFYKYVSNRFLTILQNSLMGMRLSEYHTGFRAYSRETLKQVEFLVGDDGFAYDIQILTRCILQGLRIGEISVPTKYFAEASSISLVPSLVYGFGVLRCCFQGKLCQWGLRGFCV